MAAAEAELAAAEATLKQAQRRANPLETIAEEAELAAAQAALREAQEGLSPLKVSLELAAAQAEVASAEARLALAQADLADTELRAPFSGTIVSLEDTIIPETTVIAGILVVRLADLSAWKIETDDLDERSAINLHEGDPVTIKIDALPQQDLSGTVTRISEFGEKKQGDITYTVFITPEETDLRLRWNLTATVRIGEVGTGSEG